MIDPCDTGLLGPDPGGRMDMRRVWGVAILVLVIPTLSTTASKPCYIRGNGYILLQCPEDDVLINLWADIDAPPRAETRGNWMSEHMYGKSQGNMTDDINNSFTICTGTGFRTRCFFTSIFCVNELIFYYQCQCFQSRGCTRCMNAECWWRLKDDGDYDYSEEEDEDYCELVRSERERIDTSLTEETLECEDGEGEFITTVWPPTTGEAAASTEENVAAIAGGVVGGILLIALIALIAVLVLCKRGGCMKKKPKSIAKKESGTGNTDQQYDTPIPVQLPVYAEVKRGKRKKDATPRTQDTPALNPGRSLYLVENNVYENGDRNSSIAEVPDKPIKTGDSLHLVENSIYGRETLASGAVNSEGSPDSPQGDSAFINYKRKGRDLYDNAVIQK